MAVAKKDRQGRPARATAAASPSKRSSSKRSSASPQERLKAAHAKFMQVEKGEGTPAYDKAWEELLDALFVNAK